MTGYLDECLWRGGGREGNGMKMSLWSLSFSLVKRACGSKSGISSGRGPHLGQTQGEGKAAERRREERGRTGRRAPAIS